MALRGALATALVACQYALPESQSVGDSGPRWLVITDIHYDPFYGTARASDDRGAHCASPTASPFGQFGCDSPWALVESMLVAAHAEEPNPDAVLMLGDFTRHNMKQLDDPTAVIQEIWQNVSALAANLWPSVRPVFHLQPLIGNNDLQSNYGVNVTTDAPPGHSANGSSVVDPWMEQLSHAWAGSFSEEEQISWLHGGFYVREQPVGSGNLIVSLNTVAYSPYANIPPQFASDPLGQWQWLEQSVLKPALASGGKQRVYITGHVPPMVDDLYFVDGAPHGNHPMWAATHVETFLALTSTYSDVIRGLFFSHTHRDTFRLMPPSSASAAASASGGGGQVPLLVFSALSPVNLCNPSFTALHMDGATGDVADAFHYYMPLPLQEEPGQRQVGLPRRPLAEAPQWRFEYSALAAYPELKGSLSNAAFTALYANFSTSDVLWAAFWNRTQADSKRQQPCTDDRGPALPPGCKRSMLCAHRFLVFEDFTRCCAEAAAEEEASEAEAEAAVAVGW